MHAFTRHIVSFLIICRNLNGRFLKSWTILFPAKIFIKSRSVAAICIHQPGMLMSPFFFFFYQLTNIGNDESGGLCFISSLGIRGNDQSGSVSCSSMHKIRNFPRSFFIWRGKFGMFFWKFNSFLPGKIGKVNCNSKNMIWARDAEVLGEKTIRIIDWLFPSQKMVPRKGNIKSKLTKLLKTAVFCSFFFFFLWNSSDNPDGLNLQISVGIASNFNYFFSLLMWPGDKTTIPWNRVSKEVREQTFWKFPSYKKRKQEAGDFSGNEPSSNARLHWCSHVPQASMRASLKCAHKRRENASISILSKNMSNNFVLFSDKRCSIRTWNSTRIKGIFIKEFNQFFRLFFI